MTGDLMTGGNPPGILSLSPRVLQCEECGVTADAATREPCTRCWLTICDCDKDT